MNNRILVAGASGLAGSSVLKAIHEKMPDTPVTATYNRTPPSLQFPLVSWVKADLTTRDGCRAAVKGCSSAIMVAANGGGIASAMVNQGHQVTDNLVMDTLMLEAMHTAGVSRVVYISSATVYQDMEGSVREDMLDLNQDPHPTYAGVAWAKRAAEKLCWFWNKTHGMEIVIARSSNIYGPFAKFDPARSNFIPAIIRKAVDGMDPFELWGSPDITRDVIYSEDFGGAVLALHNAVEIKYDIFNLGYGRPVTVGSVVDTVLLAADFKPSKVLYKESSHATTKARILDCSKINEVVGWKPEFTPLEGIRKTVEWWRKNRLTWKK